jgi:hypothetical protein
MGKPYKGRFLKGSMVRVISRAALETFAQNWNALVVTDFTDSHRECPSCGKNYHNWWWRQPPDGNNSNTYTFNMIYNWGKTPPAELNAPGYELSSGYAGYF